MSKKRVPAGSAEDLQRKQRKKAAFQKIEKFLQEGYNLNQSTLLVAENDKKKADALRKAFARSKMPKVKKKKKTLFSQVEERHILAILFAFSMASKPLTATQLGALVSNMMDMPEDWNSQSWAYNFRTRHKDEIQAAKLRGLDRKRQGKNLFDDVVTFLDGFGGFMREKGLSSQNFVNADEFRITFTGNANKDQRLIRRHMVCKGIVENGMGRAASFLPFIGADGHVYLTLFVLAASLDDEGNAFADLGVRKYGGEGRNKHPVFYSVTKSGYVSQSLWDSAVQQFQKEWYIRNPGVKPTLLLDNLNIHRNEDSLQWLKDHDVEVVFLPPYTTHVLQPFDNTIFQVLKVCALSYYNFHSIATDMTQAELLLQAVQENEKKITGKVARKAFSETGFHPYDRAKILSNAKKAFLPKKEKPTEPSVVDSKIVDAFQKVVTSTFSNPSKKTRGVKLKAHEFTSGASLLQKYQDKANAKELQAAQKAESKRKQAEERAALIEQRKAEKEAQRILRKCKGPHKDGEKAPVRSLKAKNSTWYVCGSCEVFCLCKKCLKGNPNLKSEHNEICQ